MSVFFLNIILFTGLASCAALAALWYVQPEL